MGTGPELVILEGRWSEKLLGFVFNFCWSWCKSNWVCWMVLDTQAKHFRPWIVSNHIKIELSSCYFSKICEFFQESECNIQLKMAKLIDKVQTQIELRCFIIFWADKKQPQWVPLVWLIIFTCHFSNFLMKSKILAAFHVWSFICFPSVQVELSV